IEAARYPPAGWRSKGGQRGYVVESTPFIVVMIESVKGVAAAAEIAAVQGVDAVMVGLGDLSASMGVETADAACFEAVDAVVAAGKAASRPVIIAGLRDAAACGKMVAHGASPFF